MPSIAIGASRVALLRKVDREDGPAVTDVEIFKGLLPAQSENKPP